MGNSVLELGCTDGADVEENLLMIRVKLVLFAFIHLMIGNPSAGSDHRSGTIGAVANHKVVRVSGERRIAGRTGRIDGSVTQFVQTLDPDVMNTINFGTF